jgi:gamma-glutamyltranspeptidase/glutathione hydrolase
MVTAPHHLAAQTGLDVLKDGGTAVEACVAVAAALAAVYPHMTGIGGDGFWLIAEPDGRVRSVDAGGVAGARVALPLYTGHARIPWRGPLAANTVAGTVSGWCEALAHDGGSLPLQRLLRDAIHFAEAGVPVTRGGAACARTKGAELRIQPGSYAATFESRGRPLAESEILRQPALAGTLRALASDGLQGFYTGAVGRSIASDLAKLGSPLTADDLARHKAGTPAPLSVTISGARLFNMPPPTQGLASLLILALFDRLGVDEVDSFAHVHSLVEATKQAFLVRDAHVGDPSYMTMDPQALLDDGDQLEAMTKRIDPVRALPWPQPSKFGDTTWFGAADGRGQVVSSIQSTYFEFGSGIVLPETGIVWHNRGASFQLATAGWNALRPGRKPFQTLNPALARFDDGRVMAYGTMGGEGQPQTQAAIFSRYARFGRPLQAAITAPRWLLGKTWGDETTSLKVESRFDPALIMALTRAGHDVEVVDAFDERTGHAGAIVRHPSGLLEGATDPRSDGLVAGW